MARKLKQTEEFFIKATDMVSAGRRAKITQSRNDWQEFWSKLYDVEAMIRDARSRMAPVYYDEWGNVKPGMREQYGEVMDAIARYNMCEIPRIPGATDGRIDAVMDKINKSVGEDNKLILTGVSHYGTTEETDASV